MRSCTPAPTIKQEQCWQKNKPHKEVDSKRQPALQREVQWQLAGGGVGATSITLLGRRSRFGHRQFHLNFPGGFLISYALSPY